MYCTLCSGVCSIISITTAHSPMLDREGGVRDMAMACFMMSLRSPLGVERAAPDPFLSPDTGVGSTGRARAANTWNTLHPPEQCSFRAVMDSGLRASSD